jgi:hypothetical protein
MNLRYRATFIHLLASALLASVAAAVVFLVWFPGHYATLMRGAELLLLLIGCDVVMGPLLSFIICNPSKSRKELLFDYAVIAGLQLAALGYGMSVVAQSRPAFAVFAIDRFAVAAAFELERDAGTAVDPQFQPSWLGPKVVALKLPADAGLRNKALELELSGKELHTMPRYYAPYSPADVLLKAKPIDELLRQHANAAQNITASLQKTGLAPEAVVWVPVVTRFGFHTALLNKSDARIVDFLALDPY